MNQRQDADLASFLEGAHIAVTGAAGTVGSRLVRRLLEFPVAEVRALDINESELFFQAETFREDSRYQGFLCDVREESQLRRMLVGIDHAFHAAAFKHVPLCERSPIEAVQTNIKGVQNLINAAIDNRLKKVLFTSSDKAVNPTNVMGTSKLMGERLITAANALTRGGRRTVFSSTRFGNVAGSRGSVLPLFAQQIAKGGPVTLTDRQMTRFVMTLDESVEMLLKSMRLAAGGEVFVTRMQVISISDLARTMVDELAPVHGHDPFLVRVSETGARPGEKYYEELISGEECGRTFELDDSFYVVLPAFRNIYGDITYEYGCPLRPISRVYVSSDEMGMDRNGIIDFLGQPDVLPPEILSRWRLFKTT